MAWFNEDENEQESGPAAVARALAGSEQAEPPEEVPETEEQQKPVESTGQSQQPTASASSPADEEAYAYGAPVKAPELPTFKQYSSVPQESAQELAAAKTDFANRVAKGDYKPSVWRRIGGALAGGAVAFGTRNPAEGMRVADEAIGAPLSKATREEGLREQAIQQKGAAGDVENQLIRQENENAANIYNMGERNLRNQGYAANQNATARERWVTAQQRLNSFVGFTPDNPEDRNSIGTGTTVGGKTVKGAQPPAWYQDKWDKDPTNKANATTKEGLARLKAMEGAGLTLSPQDRKIIASGGKLTEPNRTSFHMPSAESEKLHMWTAAFRKDNGRPPNAAEIAAFGHQASGAMSKNLGDKIEANKDVAFQKAQTSYATSTPKDAGLYQGELQVAQNEYEQRIENATGQAVPHVEIAVDEKGNVNWGSAQQSPAAQPQAQPTAPPAAGPAQPAQQPANPQQPSGDTVELKGPGFSLKVPKGEAREGRVAVDNKGRRWVVQGGTLVPQSQSAKGRPAGNGR